MDSIVLRKYRFIFGSAQTTFIYKYIRKLLNIFFFLLSCFLRFFSSSLLLILCLGHIEHNSVLVLTTRTVFVLAMQFSAFEISVPCSFLSILYRCMWHLPHCHLKSECISVLESCVLSIWNKTTFYEHHFRNRESVQYVYLWAGAYLCCTRPFYGHYNL